MYIHKCINNFSAYEILIKKFPKWEFRESVIFLLYRCFLSAASGSSCPHCSSIWPLEVSYLISVSKAALDLPEDEETWNTNHWIEKYIIHHGI